MPTYVHNNGTNFTTADNANKLTYNNTLPSIDFPDQTVSATYFDFYKHSADPYLNTKTHTVTRHHKRLNENSHI